MSETSEELRKRQEIEAVAEEERAAAYSWQQDQDGSHDEYEYNDEYYRRAKKNPKDREIPEREDDLSKMSDTELVDSFREHKRDTFYREYGTEQAAHILSDEIKQHERGMHRDGREGGQPGDWDREWRNGQWQKIDERAGIVAELDRRLDYDYDRLRDTVDEMKRRDGLEIKDRDTRESFGRYKEHGVQRRIDDSLAQPIKDSLEKFKEVSELRERAFEKERAQDRQPDISASRDQTDDRLGRGERHPNLTQSDPDRGQKRDDAEFLGREAAHVLPQGERDRQRDAARFQNPDEKRGLEQELKPEMSLGGASSEPKVAQAKGAEREKEPAQAEQKAETKKPLSALGRAAAYFDRKRDEAAKPAEQKQADQKGEQKAETKKPLSVLGRAAAYFDRKQAEQPKPAEEQARKM